MTTERWSSATVRPELWVDQDADPRTALARPAGEKETLWNYLKHHRLTLEMKCEGLDAEQMARRSVPPSTMSLLGLVRHLAQVERGWFDEVLAGGADLGPLYAATAEQPDPEFDGAVGDPTVVAEAWDTWRRQVSSADAWFAQLPEDGLGDMVPRRGSELPVRDVLVHMVEEYARHIGHADLLRECIDGRVGE